MATRESPELYDMKDAIIAAVQPKLQCDVLVESVVKKDIDNFWDKVTFGPVIYGSVPPTAAKDVTKVDQEFINDSDTTDQKTFEKTVTSTATLTWTVTGGLKVGGEAKFKAGLPLNMAEGKVSPEFNLGISRAQTWTDTQTWKENTIINVPKRSKVNVTLSILQTDYKTDFSVEVMAPAKYEFRVKVSYSSETTKRATSDSADSAMKASSGQGVGDPGAGAGAGIFLLLSLIGDFLRKTEYTVTAKEVFQYLPEFREDKKNGLVSCKVRGRFSGAYGLKSKVKKTQENL